MRIDSPGKQHTETTLGTKIASIVMAVSLAIGTTITVKQHISTIKELENREGVVLKPRESKEIIKMISISDNNPALDYPKNAVSGKGDSLPVVESEHTLDTSKIPNDTINFMNRLKEKVTALKSDNPQIIALYKHIYNWLHSAGTTATDINNVFSEENLKLWYSDMDNTEIPTVLMLITVRIENYTNNNERDNILVVSNNSL